MSLESADVNHKPCLASA